MKFTHIKNDVFGNPRVVVHFTVFEHDMTEHRGLPIESRYDEALRLAKKIGGKRYRGSAVRDGIVFQTYSVTELEKSIRSVAKCAHDTALPTVKIKGKTMDTLGTFYVIRLIPFYRTQKVCDDACMYALRLLSFYTTEIIEQATRFSYPLEARRYALQEAGEYRVQLVRLVVE